MSLQGLGTDGGQQDRLALHDQIIQVFHEEQGLGELVVKEDVFEAIQEDNALLVLQNKLVDDAGQQVQGFGVNPIPSHGGRKPLQADRV